MQGSQLAVEARELALESFAHPCFACHVSAISSGMVKAWIETILHVFETLFVGLLVGRLPKRYQEPVLVFRELKPKFAVSAHQL